MFLDILGYLLRTEYLNEARVRAILATGEQSAPTRKGEEL